MMIPLPQGTKRPAVTLLQQGLNARSKQRGMPLVKVDGHLGADTMAAVQRVGRALGAMEATLKLASTLRVVSVGLQRMIRWPESRNAAQLQRAKDRATATQTATGPAAALAEAKRHIGKSESTHNGLIMGWIKKYYWSGGRVAWCGIFCRHLLVTAGVQGTTTRMAGVVLILEDAIHGRNGMRRVVYRRKTAAGSVTAGKPGDLVGLYGEGTHVEMIARRVPGGYVCRGGNTSQKSVANGRAVGENVRPDSAVVYIVRPKY